MVALSPSTIAKSSSNVRLSRPASRQPAGKPAQAAARLSSPRPNAPLRSCTCLLVVHGAPELARFGTRAVPEKTLGCSCAACAASACSAGSGSNPGCAAKA